MAEKLVQIYEEAQEIGGLKAKMRLAILTQMSSTKAAEAPDTPENIQIFTDAMKEIQKEF